MDLRTLSTLIIVEQKFKDHDFLILKPEERAGIAIALVVGPKCKEIKVGDELLLGSHIGQPFHYEGKDYLILREEHVLGVKR
jgi:co-chaperonin GroES (HSP10)